MVTKSFHSHCIQPVTCYFRSTLLQKEQIITIIWCNRCLHIVAEAPKLVLCALGNFAPFVLNLHVIYYTDIAIRVEDKICIHTLRIPHHSRAQWKCRSQGTNLRTKYNENNLHCLDYLGQEKLQCFKGVVCTMYTF